jgi:hypothetical protein
MPTMATDIKLCFHQSLCEGVHVFYVNVTTSHNLQRSFCFMNMPTCKGRPVQWTPRGCSHSVLEITFPVPIICLSLLRVARKAHHHIGPPQSFCRILPWHIMTLYQKDTSYWSSSIIYAAYCLGNMAFMRCKSRVVVEVCGVMLPTG